MKQFCLKQEIAFVFDNNQLWIKIREGEKYLLLSGMGNASAHLLAFCTQALVGQKGNLFLWSEIPREGHTNTHISVTVRGFSTVAARWGAPLVVLQVHTGDTDSKDAKPITTGLGVLRTAMLRQLLCSEMEPFSIAINEFLVNPSPHGGVMVKAGTHTMHWSPIQLDRMIRATAMALELMPSTADKDKERSDAPLKGDDRFVFNIPEIGVRITSKPGNTTTWHLFVSDKRFEISADDMVRILCCLEVARGTQVGTDTEESLPRQVVALGL